MRETINDDGAGDSEDTSSSSFMVIGGGNDDEDGCRERMRTDRRHLAHTLDSKLKKLQRNAASNAAVKHHTSSPRRPVFVTTVKTGIFLDPPPDLAALLGLEDRSSTGSTAEYNRYYSYSSQPRVLYDKQHQRASRKIERQPE